LPPAQTLRGEGRLLESFAPYPTHWSARLEAQLRAQRSAFTAEGRVAAEVRVDRLARALDLLVSHQQQICEALADDFGQRPAALTRFVDVMPAVRSLKFARANLRSWMRPERPRLGLPAGAPGARAEIRHQPLGVVGVISPWNFPVTLSFGPLAGIFAAGNRCMIKPSELTPALGTLLQQLVVRRFDPAELVIVPGDAAVAAAFSQLPFDHLLFTGSTAVGRRVMAAAAANLVPVTLELGGKSPVIIGRSAALHRAVDRILLGKLANAGQMCVAPDYACVPGSLLDEFVEEARAWVARAYPGMPLNPDYTGMVSQAHAERMSALVDDARSKGAQVIELGAARGATGASDRMCAPALILGATAEMRVMQEEIFGPLLPVESYERIEEAIAAINARPRPLALYYFGTNRAEMNYVLERTVSGGVTVNDVAMHFLAEELPFGGIGASGMGAYHGIQGFHRFSHARAIFRQTPLDVAGLIGLRPPYAARLRQVLNWLIRR
jgi:coniferyl-aldehyde dehydrogenase